MAVSERERESERNASERTRGTRDFNDTDVTDIAPYHMPITASLRGRAVKIIATGNAQGHSSVSQCVDAEGRIEWVETERLTVADTNCLPPSSEALVNLARNFR